MSPSRATTSRPSLPFFMKTSREGPSIVKSTREELQARVKLLAKKKRSVKHKAQAPPKSSLAIRGKVPRLGASSPPTIAKGWGCLTKFQLEVRCLLPWPRCLRWWVRKIPRGGVRSFLLLFCLFMFGVPWCQTSSVLLRRRRTRERGCFGTEWEEGSLLANSELVAGVVSSILRDYDLRRADAMSVEDVLALSLQGATIVCPDAFICLSYL